MHTLYIGVLVGSLRRDSYSRKLANNLAALIPEHVQLNFIDLSELPMYNQDFDDDGTPPNSYTSFRSSLKRCDAVLFVTPEYNRSVPAVLKNAIDIGSRPYGKNIWDGKPGAIISVSPGHLSAFGANHHLRQSMVFLNILTLQQPEAYIGNIKKLLDENGKINNEETILFLKSFVAAFLKWIEQVRK